MKRTLQFEDPEAGLGHVSDTLEPSSIDKLGQRQSEGDIVPEEGRVAVADYSHTLNLSKIFDIEYDILNLTEFHHVAWKLKNNPKK